MFSRANFLQAPPFFPSDLSKARWCFLLAPPFLCIRFFLSTPPTHPSPPCGSSLFFTFFSRAPESPTLLSFSLGGVFHSHPPLPLLSLHDSLVSTSSTSGRAGPCAYMFSGRVGCCPSALLDAIVAQVSPTESYKPSYPLRLVCQDGTSPLLLSFSSYSSSWKSTTISPFATISIFHPGSRPAIFFSFFPPILSPCCHLSLWSSTNFAFCLPSLFCPNYPS